MRPLFIAIAALALFISFSRLASVTLFDVDEAVFAEATREMVRGGDYITPHYDGENRFDKPVFFYWMMAASYKLFGIDEFGARFPSALSGFLLVLATFFFVRRFRGEEEAFYAAGAMVLSVYYLVYSHAAVTDMALTLFIGLSLMSLYISFHDKKAYIYGFYLFSALAFLTKGLIGIIFPFTIGGVYLLLSGRKLRELMSLPGMALFLLVSGPWYGAQLAINGREFIDQFIIKHHLERYLGVISGHKGPLWYYLPMLAAGLFPWAGFLPAGIKRALKERKTDGFGLFALIWSSFIFVFFTFSTTKLPNYILPAVPAAAMLIALGISPMAKRGFGFYFVALASAVLGIALLFSDKYLSAMGIQAGLWPRFGVAAFLFLSACGASFIPGIWRKKAYWAVPALSAAALCVLALQALPLASERLQGDLYRYSTYAKEKLPYGEPVITYGINNPSVVFYSGHMALRLGPGDNLRPFLQSANRAVAISSRKDAADLEEQGMHIVSEDKTYALLEK